MAQNTKKKLLRKQFCYNIYTVSNTVYNIYGNQNEQEVSKNVVSLKARKSRAFKAMHFKNATERSRDYRIQTKKKQIFLFFINVKRLPIYTHTRSYFTDYGSIVRFGN